MDSTEDTFKPPYMSFQTFWNFIAELGEKPLPPQIDRSMLRTKSGTDQMNLVATLKGFGLIRDDGTVTPRLLELVGENSEGRAKLLGELVRGYYEAPLRVSADNGTEKLLHDSFAEAFGYEGNTRRKAITFFLHAARTAGIPLSPHFPVTRTGAGGGSSPPVKRGPRRKTAPATTPDRGGAGASRPAGEVKVIDFGEAGAVTVTVGVKWLELPTAKMVALRKLVDDFEALGEASWTPPETAT